MDGKPDVSRLVQTASSRSQGAQCIPVREKKSYREGLTLHPPWAAAGDRGQPPTCSVTPPARLPIPKWGPHHHSSHPVSLPQHPLPGVPMSHG